MRYHLTPVKMVIVEKKPHKQQMLEMMWIEPSLLLVGM